MIGIYKVTNLINGKSYIGQSNNILRRKREHLTRYQSEYTSEYDSVFHRALRKYGINNFQWSILEQCSIEELNKKEIYWIAFYHTWIYDEECQGYNVTPGGNARCIKPNLKIEKIILDLQNSNLTQNEIAKKYNLSIGTICNINNGKSWYDPEFNYPLRINKNKYYCIDCGKQLKYQAKRCKTCQLIFQSKILDLPSREELKQLIRTKPFTQIGKQFGVSDNAIRKWCNKYNLPQKSKEIKSYSNEEWELI